MKKPLILVLAPIADFNQLREIFDERFELGVALNHSMAESWLKRKKPDLLLLSAAMVEKPDGGNYCHDLKADGEATQNVPILLITENDEQKNRSFELDIADYICKPFLAQEVRRRVGTHISLHKAQAAEQHYQEQVSDAFGRFVSPEVADSFVRNYAGSGDPIKLGGKRCKVAIMMADIRSFTHYQKGWSLKN